MSHHNKLCIGIDVAKHNFDVAFSDHSQEETIPATTAGLNRLLASLKKSPVDLVCLEATGRFHRKLVAPLHQHDIPVAAVNARQIRDFAKANNQLAKTDRIDARIIARFGLLMNPRLTLQISESQQKIRDLTARRRQVGKLLVQEKNRLSATDDEEVRLLIEQAITFYETQERELNKRIAALIDADEQAQAKARIIDSVPGLGPASVALLVSELPELGQLNRQQIARLVGVAPTNRDSGTLRGKRTTGGGRVQIRNGLYMPLVVAHHHNPVIRAFYDRLVRNGKPKLVALIATTRKLLSILNVMIRNRETWKFNPQKT